MSELPRYLENIKTAAIAGHVNPDGDCIGSCLGMYLYLRDNYPDIRTVVYMEKPQSKFSYLEGFREIRTELTEADKTPVDLLILLDFGGIDRIGVARPLMEYAEKTLCIDHHRTNHDSFTWKINYPDASSASEVLYDMMDPDKISPACAAALYTGIAHDTGIFQYSCTSPHTMRIAAALMEKGIPYSRIIDDSYYQKTWAQNQILGTALSSSMILMGGQVIASWVTRDEMDACGAEPSDMDGIVSQMRNTAGVEVSVFMYEIAPDTFRVSLRSKERADVSQAAVAFGGGGHARAAGCTMTGRPDSILESILTELQKEL